MAFNRKKKLDFSALKWHFFGLASNEDSQEFRVFMIIKFTYFREGTVGYVGLYMVQ